MGSVIIKVYKQRRWDRERNRIVCRLLEKDKFLSPRDALRMANQRMRVKYPNR